MSRAVMQRALEALEHLHRTGDTQVFDLCYAPELIPALRAALAEPEYPQGQASTDVGVPVYVVKKAEPVAWMQEMPVSGNEERSVRMTTVKMVADGWENPIPLFTQPAQALAEPDHIADASKLVEPGREACSNTFACRCPKHFAAPTPRTPLTDAQHDALMRCKSTLDYGRAVEAAHGITGEQT